MLVMFFVFGIAVFGTAGLKLLGGGIFNLPVVCEGTLFKIVKQLGGRGTARVATCALGLASLWACALWAQALLEYVKINR